MSNNIIATDLQGQFIDSPLVYLYELTLGDGLVLYFHPGLDADLEEVRFYSLQQASLGNNSANTSIATTNAYVPLPIAMEGVEFLSDGASNRPTITIANVTAIFKTALQNNNFTFETLVGKKITCRRTFEKYLYGGSSQSTPYELPVQSYIIDRVSAETSTSVVFELAAPFDVAGIKLPNRVVVGKYCSWEYQGASIDKDRSACSWPLNNIATYAGASYEIYFDVEDRPLIESGLVSFNTWTAGTYSINSFVSYDNKKWRSETDTNTDIPATNNVNWQEVIEWNTWSASTTYSVGDYVKVPGNNKIWKCINSNTNQEPDYLSSHWVRVDYCSKRLTGCKSRFQFVPLNSQNVPSASKKTNKALPFGAYIGTAKFK